MKRRDLIKSAVLGAGAAATTSAQHVHVKTIAPAAAAAHAKGEWTPRVFDPHQNETVVQLTELIIPTTDTPGAKAAKVNEYIDLMLADASEDHGHSFLKGLGWLDGYSIKKHQMPFVKLSEGQQVKILETLDGATDEELQPGADFFKQVKKMTVTGYYTSKIGIAELNKEGVPSTFACAQESHA